MKRRYIQHGATAVAVLASVCLIGCGTTAGYKQADKTGQGIADFRQEITKAKQAVDDTVSALGQVAVTANTNPREAFQTFSKSLANLESAAERARKRADDMRAKGQAYFNQWQQEMAQVKNPDIRKLAEERKAKLQASFDNIKKYTEPLKTQFDAWMSDLKDLKTYLGNDLTVTGVDAAKSLFAKAQSEGFEVQKSMDALIAELNTVAATVTPAEVKAE